MPLNFLIFIRETLEMNKVIKDDCGLDKSTRRTGEGTRSI